jgi:hypothetical protein
MHIGEHNGLTAGRFEPFKAAAQRAGFGQPGNEVFGV